MKHRWIRIVGTVVLVSTVFPTLFIAQTAQTGQTEQAPGPYARIAIMRALDGHTVELEAGYIRHLEWHRQTKDKFGWYSYSVWASTERQGIARRRRAGKPHQRLATCPIPREWGL